MKNRISTGIWLLFFGIIILLHNFDIIDFNFYSIWKYWPLLLVSLGLNLILQNRQNGHNILIIFNVLVCTFLVYTGVTSQERFDFTWKHNPTVNTGTDFSETASSVSTEYNNEIEKASLEFNLGAAHIKLDEGSGDDLLKAHSTSENLGLKLETSGSETHKKLSLNSATKDNSGKKNTIQLQLNQAPLWEFEFNLGAAKLEADFSPYKFSNLEINAGAASFDLKFGLPQVQKTKVEINTAASSCVINIPKEAACQVDATALISNKNFEGFQRIDDILQTENFNSAMNKYYIEINGAVNSIKINRY